MTPSFPTRRSSALHGQPLYMSLYAAGIIFFCFFYVAVVFNPEETADNLKSQNGFIPGIRPGKNTAAYLDFVLTRITVIGAAYLALICVVPEYFIARSGLPFQLGVTSMLYDNGDYPQSVEKAVDLLDLPAVRERQARGEPDG